MRTLRQYYHTARQAIAGKIPDDVEWWQDNATDYDIDFTRSGWYHCGYITAVHKGLEVTADASWSEHDGIYEVSRIEYC